MNLLLLGLLLGSIAHAADDLSEIEDKLVGRIDAQFDCISTPAEYAAAFEARSPRCVSDELFGRLSWGPTVAAATAEDTSSRLAYSFAGADVLAKLLRVGYPNASGAPGGPAAASGLLRAGTGAAVLQLAGVSPERWDASQVYVLSVFPRTVLDSAAAALQDGLPYGGGVGPLAPTWPALADYFAYVFEAATLNISDAALGLLQAASFAELTGCPPVCAYAAAGFPAANATAPVVVRNLQPGAVRCPPPDCAGLEPVAPTGLTPGSELCSAEWREARADIAALLPHNATCTPEGNAAAGGGLAQLLAGAAGDPRRQALLLRSFVMAPCAGGMDTLFAGDGMRYSAAGGLLVPQGTEFITSPFQLSPLSSTAVARMPFCAGGGRPGADGRCALP